MWNSRRLVSGVRRAPATLRVCADNRKGAVTPERVYTFSSFAPSAAPLLCVVLLSLFLSFSLSVSTTLGRSFFYLFGRSRLAYCNGRRATPITSTVSIKNDSFRRSCRRSIHLISATPDFQIAFRKRRLCDDSVFLFLIFFYFNVLRVFLSSFQPNVLSAVLYLRGVISTPLSLSLLHLYFFFLSSPLLLSCEWACGVHLFSPYNLMLALL